MIGTKKNLIGASLVYVCVFNVSLCVCVCVCITCVSVCVYSVSGQDGTWEGNLSSYFDMNIFLDIILTCVFKNAGKRRILFSSFHPDICSM